MVPGTPTALFRDHARRAQTEQRSPAQIASSLQRRKTPIVYACMAPQSMYSPGALAKKPQIWRPRAASFALLRDAAPNPSQANLAQLEETYDEITCIRPGAADPIGHVVRGPIAHVFGGARDPLAGVLRGALRPGAGLGRRGLDPISDILGGALDPLPGRGELRRCRGPLAHRAAGEVLAQDHAADGQGARCCPGRGHLAARGPLTLPLGRCLDLLALLGQRHGELRALFRLRRQHHRELPAGVVGVLDLDALAGVGGNHNHRHGAGGEDGLRGRDHAAGRADLALLPRVQVPLQHAVEAVFVVLAPQVEQCLRAAHEEGTLQDGVLLRAVVRELALKLHLELALLQLFQTPVALAAALALALAPHLAFRHALAPALAGSDSLCRRGRLRRHRGDGLRATHAAATLDKGRGLRRLEKRSRQVA
mmetsp:Transcript_103034/g.296721  ORF Transcript_103034/g.296721 Transcript_103034/m.296721 type:complete len:423 (-) Transcript_103034:7-1275(-)